MPEPVDSPSPGRTTAGRPWIAGCAEVILAFGTAVGFALWARDIEVAPLDRWAQVSGLAAMGFRVTMIAIVLVAALVIAARVRSGVAFDLTSRLVCAVVAGLVSGMVAGGLVVALRGTPWGLNGSEGDAGDLINWTLGVREGKEPPFSYPPLTFHLIDRYARLRELEVFTAVKHMEILGTAALGPIAYLGWRLLLRPGWALGIGLIAALPLIDVAPYKPYTSIVLIGLVPLLIRLLQLIRHADRYSHAQLARRGVLLGLALGGLCLLYSGWFKWSSPGFLFAVLVVFPWRSRVAAGKAVLFGALALAMFGLLAGGHVIDALRENFPDDYHYFDVMTEPGYIAMYRNDLPGAVGSWPPLGELGGVGVFTIVLCAGFAASVVLGRGRTVVIGVGSMMVGCWLMRFYYARDLYESGLVQLYPRTTAEIQYCLLISCGYAVYLAVERVARQAPPESPLRSPSGLIGSVCGLLLLLGMAASSICDHYMPTDSTPHGPGWLALNAQKQRNDRLVPVARAHGSEPPTVKLTLYAGGWNVTRKGIESSNTCRSSCVTPAIAAITGRRWGDLVLELTLQITDPGATDENWAGVTIHKTNQADGLGTSGQLVYYRANGILEVIDPHQGVLATVDTKLRPTTARRLRVEATGERVRVLVDGVLFVDVDPRAGPGAAGFVDFVSYGVTATYEDLTLPR